MKRAKLTFINPVHIVNITGDGMKVLAIGAHPDDIEFGCGGTIMKHIKRGDEVVFIVLSHGEKSGSREERKKEAMDSAKRFGAKLYIFGFPDTKIPDDHDVIEKIEAVVKEFRPDRVYTHSVKDTHQDHRKVAYATLAAARRVAEILAYESPSLYLNFHPNYYIDISDFVDRKTESLKAFATQNSKEYMKIEAIKGLAQFRGLLPQARFAEAFEAIRIIRSGDV